MAASPLPLWWSSAQP